MISVIWQYFSTTTKILFHYRNSTYFNFTVLKLVVNLDKEHGGVCISSTIHTEIAPTTVHCIYKWKLACLGITLQVIYKAVWIEHRWKQAFVPFLKSKLLGELIGWQFLALPKGLIKDSIIKLHWFWAKRSKSDIQGLVII